jgi:CRISPR/Cas system endoribonuclease Cas6 (RAMP superfamily)
MRIKVSFAPRSFPASFPLDNHPLSSLIYRTLGEMAPDYAEFLHEEGYSAPEREEAGGRRVSLKRFRFFVYSRPRFGSGN